MGNTTSEPHSVDESGAQQNNGEGNQGEKDDQATTTDHGIPDDDSHTDATKANHDQSYTQKLCNLFDSAARCIAPIAEGILRPTLELFGMMRPLRDIQDDINGLAPKEITREIFHNALLEEVMRDGAQSSQPIEERIAAKAAELDQSQRRKLVYDYKLKLELRGRREQDKEKLLAVRAAELVVKSKALESFNAYVGPAVDCCLKPISAYVEPAVDYSINVCAGPALDYSFAAGSGLLARTKSAAGNAFSTLTKPLTDLKEKADSLERLAEETASNTVANVEAAVSAITGNPEVIIALSSFLEKLQKDYKLENLRENTGSNPNAQEKGRILKDISSILTRLNNLEFDAKHDETVKDACILHYKKMLSATQQSAVDSELEKELDKIYDAVFLPKLRNIIAQLQILRDHITAGNPNLVRLSLLSFRDPLHGAIPQDFYPTHVDRNHLMSAQEFRITFFDRTRKTTYAANIAFGSVEKVAPAIREAAEAFTPDRTISFYIFWGVGHTFSFVAVFYQKKFAEEMKIGFPKNSIQTWFILGLYMLGAALLYASYVRAGKTKYNDATGFFSSFVPCIIVVGAATIYMCGIFEQKIPSITKAMDNEMLLCVFAFSFGISVLMLANLPTIWHSCKKMINSRANTNLTNANTEGANTERERPAA